MRRGVKDLPNTIYRKIFEVLLGRCGDLIDGRDKATAKFKRGIAIAITADRKRRRK